MAGKVDGIDGMFLCERGLCEKPAIEIAAKAVNQNDRRAFCVTHLEVAHPPSADLGRLRLEGLRPALGHGLGDKLCGEFCDKGVDIGVGYFFLREHGQQRTDRQGLANLGDASAQHTGRG